MAAELPSNSVIRFGLFQADLRTGELRKNGAKIRVQELPFRALKVFVSRPQELVTREELRQELWPPDVFVDFDRGIITAVNRLRDTLGDSPENPVFLETVGRRGYRWIAPIRTEEATTRKPDLVAQHPTSSLDERAAGTTLVAPDEKKAQPNASIEIEAPPLDVAPQRTRTRRSWTWITAAALIVVALIFGGLYYRSRSLRRLSDQDTIVLADFTNNTSEQVFDDTMKTALAISLQQSPFLNILPESRVSATLRMMTSPTDARLTPPIARELCQRTQSKAYIAGAIASLGSDYVLQLKAVNCESGDTLAEEQMTASSKEKVLDTLGKAASSLRGKLGESLATVQKFDVPLEDATTRSLDALKVYSLGRKADNEKGHAGLPYDQRAVELDPNFALAYEAIGNDYSNLGEPERANEHLTKAFELREHTSEWERLKIAADYYREATGELDKADRTYQQQLQSYPLRIGAYNNLGTLYALEGHYEVAAEYTREYIRRTPGRAGSYGNLANDALALQNFDEARQIISDAQMRKMDHPVFHTILYALAFLANDSQQMTEQTKWLAGRTDYEHWGLALASDTEAYAGRLRKASELSHQAVSSALRADSKEMAGVDLANAALRQAAFGNTAEARRLASQALKLVPTSPAVEDEAALAFAMAGDSAAAGKLSEDLAKRFALHTQIQSLWLPAIRAQLALNRKDSANAITILQAASPIELGQIPFVMNLSCLYPTYLRGEAYLAAGRGEAAAVEFQKIIDHNGIVWNCWTGALAQLGLARATALQRNNASRTDADAARVRALIAYNKFLTLWRESDPDLPILKEAKAEYAKLQ